MNVADHLIVQLARVDIVAVCGNAHTLVILKYLKTR
ncbi:hypothetical protein TBK1r_40820 [Stieleria magnilauensis]|uniref:Uncharacterized protein n=1 Tax=Stieleria magnilauensis TaxID=2527963 RepID=A0ABX5XSY9_9BACT|nr:hypothetical protein TBK1r_40820 [Planctomycetes bacterium TBK1r]